MQDSREQPNVRAQEACQQEHSQDQEEEDPEAPVGGRSLQPP